MPVAKSYQTMEIVEGPYSLNGRQYVKVNNGKNTIKQVRWYSEAEYKKMYPDTTVAVISTQKEALGFQEGYITIFKGDTYSYLEWFQEKKECRYCRWWGWYVVSTEKVPADLPAGIIPMRLPWDCVGTDNGTLQTEDKIKTAIDSILYSPGLSEWVGEIGERLEIKIKITGNYVFEETGSIMHTMEDAIGNVYTWTTASKNWPIGAEKLIRGTVKEHRTYKNVKQTVLTRCLER